MVVESLISLRSVQSEPERSRNVPDRFLTTVGWRSKIGEPVEFRKRVFSDVPCLFLPAPLLPSKSLAHECSLDREAGFC